LHLVEPGKGMAARFAPGGPEVDQNHLAAQARQVERICRISGCSSQRKAAEDECQYHSGDCDSRDPVFSHGKPDKHTGRWTRAPGRINRRVAPAAAMPPTGI